LQKTILILNHFFLLSRILQANGDLSISGGKEGVVIECYMTPTEAYCVDLRLPDSILVGGWRYENAILQPTQFEVLPQSHVDILVS